MWYQKIIQIFKVKELRNKILFVLALLAVFRVMANIPIPGIDADKLRELFNNLRFLGILNIFTGGALQKLSIAMLGLGPYITAVIILQLLTMIFPSLEKMYKEGGPAERQKFNQYGRIAAVPLAMLQSYGMLTLLQGRKIIGALSPLVLVSSILTISAATMFLMWLGELISEKGIGNGVSLIIFAGIIAGFPTNIQQMFVDMSQNPSALPGYLLFFALAILIIAGVVLINEGRRNVPVSYAKRVRGRKMFGGVSTYLPLLVNPAGVIPIIFALAILSFPGMLAGFLGKVGGWVGSVAQQINLLSQNLLFLGAAEFILVFIFTFFYTLVTFDPSSVSSNLQKMGGFIPGIRPGKSTTNYLHFVLYRILPIGGLALATVAIMPSLVRGVIAGITATEITGFRFLIGGTALLIVVSVVLESMRQVNAQLQMRDYDTF